jgi:hypothetical protein
MLIETLLLAIAILFSICIAQLVSHRRWHKDVDAQLADAAIQVAWWRKRALTPGPVSPPKLPPAEPFWTRAATVCAPNYHAPRSAP